MVILACKWDHPVLVSTQHIFQVMINESKVNMSYKILKILNSLYVTFIYSGTRRSKQSDSNLDYYKTVSQFEIR